WRLTRGQVFEFFNPDSNGLGGTFGAMTYGNNQAMLQCIKAGPLCDLSKTTSQMQHEIKSLKSANQTVPLELLLQFYRRYSHPVSCILLILAAMPVALLRSRRSHSTAIVYAGVLVVAYFILQQICLSLAVNGRLDPILGAWLPGTVLCIFGLGLTLILRNR
ncbi:MAG: LptF/LptG family permease, partial [Candidatus Obscuribacterales bacterium]|nr:LptF/LptG family permease [Candidatus Obscuribacterales bacterium]